MFFLFSAGSHPIHNSNSLQVQNIFQRLDTTLASLLSDLSFIMALQSFHLLQCLLYLFLEFSGPISQVHPGLFPIATKFHLLCIIHSPVFLHYVSIPLPPLPTDNFLLDALYL